MILKLKRTKKNQVKYIENKIVELIFFLLFLHFLQINQDHAVRLVLSITFAITFSLKRTLLRFNQMHHTIANQIRLDNFLPILPLQNLSIVKKLSTNSSPTLLHSNPLDEEFMI